jgi:hypothetical protein
VIVGEISGDVFIVSIGQAAGLRPGDWLVVTSEEVAKNNKGEVLYREQKELAKLEVVDVSMADRAKTRFAEASDPAARRPREGDAVRVDSTRAKAVRLARNSGAVDATTSAGGANASGAEVEQLLKRGDRYTEDNYHAQALEYYQKADALKPGDPGILMRIASSRLYLKDFVEAESMVETIIRSGHEFSVPVVHLHYFGSCQGHLVVAKGRVAYRPLKGDHAFSAVTSDFRGAESSQNKIGMTSRPTVKIRIAGPDGKVKAIDLVLQQYLSINRGVPQGASEAWEDTQRLQRLVLRVIADAME